MTEIESPNIIQEEIRKLEGALAEKKKELTESGTEFKEEETAKEVIKEYTAQTPTTSADASSDETKKAAQILQNEPHAKQIGELLNIAQKNGIIYAVEVARHLKNPHLLDDFHDRLALELAARKK
ncbi:MAG: hypothetical protein HYY55_00675 [Candidatus Niyogibacteria bacterium]|nr:MAG: hypothetical protein HYY55_00675 [Candidatus Niyogibacteria bacterium]